MHAVIGTAGHVDHGKSALIQALTGIHPSHLPQEIARGMTIDLGFAHFITEAGDSIGIIDVPGHERFLRNMVSAIWGLDMVLLVVAADEGWSALSEEHLRVIAAFGIQQILVVLNKCDLVDTARQDAVEEDILERCLALTDSLPDVARVSALGGQGIAALKQLIAQKLANQPKRQVLNAQAHLYVDRVFSVNGIGTTVTGTLRGGGIVEGQTLSLFPSGKVVRVKSLQSYHQQLSEVAPFSRVAIGLKQVKKQEVNRGSCLLADASAISASCEWIVELRTEFSLLKKNSQVEVALGTAHTYARCFVFAEGRLARLQLKQPIAAFWGQALLLIMHGGSRIIGAARLIWTQSLDKNARQILLDSLPQLPRENPAQAQLILHLALNGFAPQSAEIVPPEGAFSLGSWLITKSCHQQLLEKLNQILDSAINAVDAEELASRSGFPSALMQNIAQLECQEKRWSQIEGAGFTRIQSGKAAILPAAPQALLEAIIAAGEQGFDANKLAQSGAQKLLRSLVERHLIVPMEEKMFFASEVYKALLSKILQGRNLGEQFSIADARECTNLARKQLIPLLNRMERDGWVKRSGDARQVCRVCAE